MRLRRKRQEDEGDEDKENCIVKKTCVQSEEKRLFKPLLKRTPSTASAKSAARQQMVQARSKTQSVKQTSIRTPKSVLVDSPAKKQGVRSEPVEIGLFNCESDVAYTGKLFGEGTDGKVQACHIRGQFVALKRAKAHDSITTDMCKRKSAIEIYYLRRVKGLDGFIQCLGMCDGIDHSCIALEVLEGKLSDYQRKVLGSRMPFPQPMAVDIIQQISRAMIHLHSKIGVAHGDLAFRNILVQNFHTDSIHVKLADFGRVLNPKDEENFLSDSISFYKNSDVGSFGRDVLYRLFVGDRIPQDLVETRTIGKLSDSYVNRIPPAAVKKLGKFANLFKRCASWGIRPTFQEILDHLNDLDYFNGENQMFQLRSGKGEPTFISPTYEGIKKKILFTPTTASPHPKRDPLDIVMNRPRKTPDTITPRPNSEKRPKTLTMRLLTEQMRRQQPRQHL